MSDELKKDESVKDEPVKVDKTEVVAEYNPVEEQARDQGWVSKDEWTADGKSESDWRPAKEFVERGEIFKSLHQVKRELRNEKAAREALQKHHNYVYEKAYQEAYSKLKLERRQALKDDNLEKVADVETEMEQLAAKRGQELQVLNIQQQAANAQAVHPEFQEWVDRNTWYATDADMREFAEAVGMIHLQKNPTVSPTDVLKHVEAKVRKQYSEKFGTRKSAPNAVAGVDRTSQRKSSGTDMVLDEMEESIMKTLVANGDMTKEQYITELKRAKGLDK